MKYNFDEIVPRRGTESVKWDVCAPGALPMWVADMDFKAAPEILEALQKRLDHGVFGYQTVPDDYFEAVGRWFERRHGWKGIGRENIVPTTGVIAAYSAAIKAMTVPGDKVIVMTPCYNAFFPAIRNNKCVELDCALKYDGLWSIDFEDLERKAAEARVLLLCNPHNPVGRVWTLDELTEVAEICRRYGVTVIADEIHCDFIRPGIKFTSFATLGDEYKQKLILCTAPSKTFNLAGLQVSNIWIPNPDIRGRFKKQNQANGYNEVNILGMTAAEACYTLGKPWLEALKEYLEGNISYVKEFLAKNIPSVHLVEPEGTYLLWLDFHETGLSNEEVKERVEGKARLWLDHGDIFGEGGELFERINIACPRNILEQAMKQLAEAFK